MKRRIDLVLPVYNEANILPRLWQRLEDALAPLDYDFRVIFVDDGSSDGSTDFLRRLAEEQPRAALVRLSRNFGHQQALTCGLDHSQADATILMDADLQDTPESLARLLEKWEEGYEVVYAVRTARKEFFLKRWAFSAFYRLQRKLVDLPLPLDAGIFSLMDRKVVRVLQGMGERNRYLPGLRAFAGFRQTGVVVERAARAHGEPRVTLLKLFKLAMDGVFSLSYVPLRVANYLGLFVAFSGFLVGFWALYTKFFTDLATPGWASNLASTFFIGGVQLVFLGILGEYLGRIYDEVKKRPYYVVGERLGIEEVGDEARLD